MGRKTTFLREREEGIQTIHQMPRSHDRLELIVEMHREMLVQLLGRGHSIVYDTRANG
jgi:hypothetical protein